MEEFKLTDQEYIQLNQLLKATGLAATGGEAMLHIDDGEVLVNGEIELKRRKKIRVGDTVKFQENTIVIVG